MDDKKVLIINFNGLGNGIMILPVLKCLEETANWLSYYHIYNPVLATQLFRKTVELKNILGFVPNEWRRFKKKDWEAIRKFIDIHQVDLIINLRNEGPLYDSGYYEFKRSVVDSKLEFWELDHEIVRSRTTYSLLVYDILSVFQKHGIDMSNYNPQLLKAFFIRKESQEVSNQKIGFFAGASQTIKRWHARKWQELGELLIKRFDCKIEVYSGLSGSEIKLAENVVGYLKEKFSEDRCEMVTNQTLIQLAYKFYNLNLLIANDSVATHLAAAMGVPTIGLYFSTIASIWSGNSNTFIPVQSQFGLNCPMMKQRAGNCLRYYRNCLAPCKDDITSHQVLQVVESCCKTGMVELGNMTIDRRAVQEEHLVLKDL